MEAHTSLVVIGFHKKYCHPDAWKTATTRPLQHIGSRNLVRSPGDFLAPRSGGTDGVEVVARVQKDNFEKLLRGSGWPQIYLCRGAKFLPGWPCTVEASFRAGKSRSAIRSAVPPHHRRLQHDFGCSLIRRAEPRKRQNAQVLMWSKPGKTTAESQKGCEILGECGPRKPRATSDSETSVRWKRVDGRDSSRCHHSHSGSRQQPGSHASVALAKVATVGHPATSAISSAGRRSRSHRYSWRRCSRLRQLSDSSGVQLHSLQTKGNEKCRQRGREVRRTRWFLLRSWRKRGGHGRSPRRAKIQLCQTYAVPSGVKGGAVFKASRRVFVAFSCAVHFTPCAHHQR